MTTELSAISHQIWDSKYRLKRPDGTPVDVTVEDTWRRVARALASAERPEEREQWSARFYDAMEGFKFIPAGRILAGAGTERSVTMINCFVMGTIPDSLDGIFTHLREAALTMQQGGGIGYDFSTLRPKGSLVKGVEADASGPLSFMDVWDAMCRTLMSAGARRGAMMACMRCDHPDIFEFVTAKQQAGRLTQFNVSVLVTEAFMEAVKEDKDWVLQFGDDPNLGGFRRIRARELWDAITRATYDHAEPGVIFIDRVNATNNLSYCETISATNPCGEEPLPPYGSCDLGSINLAALVQNPFTKHAFIDCNDLEWIVPLAVRMLDDVYDVTKFPLPQQAEEAILKRRLGLGVTGLANALTMCGLRYGSVQAAKVARSWMQSIEERAYRASAELAAEKVRFPLFNLNKYREAAVWNRLPKQVRGQIEKSGLRNSHLMAVAPTGTISLLAGNVSSGIEPPFANKFTRKLLQPDGSRIEVEVLDYAYERMLHAGAAMPEAERREFVDAWVPALATAQDLTPDEHLLMLAAVQEHVDTSVSKTINLPESISLDDFKDVYRKAYDLDCKSCTTYRPSEVRGSVLSVGEPSPLMALGTVPPPVPPTQEPIIITRFLTGELQLVPAVDEPDFKKIEEGFSESAFPFDNPEAPSEMIAARDRAMDAIDRAVRNSPPPMDDVGGVDRELFDEKDPNKVPFIEANATTPELEATQVMWDFSDANEIEEEDEPDDLLPIRPEALTGTTYKVKWADGNGEPSYYVTVNDDPVTGQPFEVFVSTLDVEHQAWTTALTRMVSAVFRRGGDVRFVAEELRAIHDPKGGAWMGGRYVPSLPAAIGDVIARHLLATKARTDGVEESKVAAFIVQSMQEDREADTVQRPPSGFRECPRCHSPSVVMQEGCARCASCEWSRCD